MLIFLFHEVRMYGMTFEELHIIPPILKALREAGYRRPTPIQEAAIPPVLKGRDLLGCAQTGTGKTAAFAVPILQLLAGRGVPQGKRPIRALVLTPTRELALQIYENFELYGRNLGLRSAVIFGGVGQAPQVAALENGVDILVATPGRLNDLIGQGHVSLGSLEIFVLDEADRMLDMGFIHDVRRVIDKTPEKKQTLLFSATMPPEIQEIADRLLHDMAVVQVDPPATTVEAIRQYVYFVDKGNKRHLLAHLLQNPELVSVLVFTRTKHGADRVARDLTRAGFPAQSIHGDKSQGARQAALAAFKEGRCRVLVATDIAARGIDIEELSHVVNFDIPEVPETYVHRIGRTGRAGLDGTAISFCTADEREDFEHILRLTKGNIETVKDHPFPQQQTEPTPKEELARQKESRRLAAQERRRQRNARQEQAAQKGQTAQKEQAAQTEQTAQAGRGRGKKQAEAAGKPSGGSQPVQNGSAREKQDQNKEQRQGDRQQSRKKHGRPEQPQEPSSRRHGGQKPEKARQNEAAKVSSEQPKDDSDRQESRQNQPKRQENRPKQSQRQGKQEKTGGPAPRQYSEQMNLKPSHRHPKKYEYKDNTRLKDDIITYTPDWGSPPSAPRFQPSSSARKKPQDQPLSDKPFRR